MKHLLTFLFAVAIAALSAAGQPASRYAEMGWLELPGYREDTFVFKTKLTAMKKILPFLLAFFLLGCTKSYPTLDDLLPPGTFNLTTFITDSAGNSVDLAGDWAVFQDPDETKFTNYLHYDQTSQSIYSVSYNKAFMLEYDNGCVTLPVYDKGHVDKPRTVFLRGATYKLIYKDGRTHGDYRRYFVGYNAPYGAPDLHVVLDENTLTYEDMPNVRLRRILSFSRNLIDNDR